MSNTRQAVRARDAEPRKSSADANVSAGKPANRTSRRSARRTEWSSSTMEISRGVLGTFNTRIQPTGRRARRGSGPWSHGRGKGEGKRRGEKKRGKEEGKRRGEKKRGKEEGKGSRPG